MLIVFSGLPGTGKTTIAQQLAATTGAVYLRIDAIEQAIRNSGVLAGDIGRSGYMVANELALSNLRLGRTVIVDCVNPVMESRVAWSEIASDSGVRLVDVQVICSDTGEHQRRVEARTADIPGLTPPTWESVQSHEYEPWADAPFCIDTAQMSAAQAVAMITERFLAEEPHGALAGRLQLCAPQRKSPVPEPATGLFRCCCQVRPAVSLGYC